MKPRLLVVVFIGIFIILSSCTTPKKIRDTGFRKDLVGTWINPVYDKYEHIPWKMIIKKNLTAESYEYIESIVPSSFSISLEDRWTDNESNIWYKVVCEGSLWKEYHLWRINSLKNVWEIMSSTSDYPSKMDPKHVYYRVFYR